MCNSMLLEHQVVCGMRHGYTQSGEEEDERDRDRGGVKKRRERESCAHDEVEVSS